MRPILLVFAALALAGCATSPPETVPVPTPYPVYCEPEARARPALPLDALPEDADLFEVMRAAKASVELLEGYVGNLESDVDSCRAPAS